MKNTVCALALALAAAPAANAVISVNFEGLKNLEPVGNYYDGGFGGLGSGPGPALGVQFVGNTLAIIDGDAAGGTGNFGNEPSPDTIMFFLSGAETVMNVPAGFTAGVSMWYTSVGATGTFSVYSGLNGTGTLLGTEVLIPLGVGPGDPNGSFSNWRFVGIDIGTNVGQSVVFGGVADQIGFDDVSFGQIPTPAAAGVLGFGALAAARRRRA